MLGMEEGTTFRYGSIILPSERYTNDLRNIIKVTPARIDFPSFGVAHTPEFDLTIITSRDCRLRLV